MTLPSSCLRIWKKINSTQGIHFLVGFDGPKMVTKSKTPLMIFFSVPITPLTKSWLYCRHGLSSLLVNGTWKIQISLLVFMVKITLFELNIRRLIRWKRFLIMTILEVQLKVILGPISSSIRQRQKPEDEGAQNMKLIWDLAENREVSKIHMLIRFSHGQMKKLLMLFLRGYGLLQWIRSTFVPKFFQLI